VRYGTRVVELAKVPQNKLNHPSPRSSVPPASKIKKTSAQAIQLVTTYLVINANRYQNLAKKWAQRVPIFL